MAHDSRDGRLARRAVAQAGVFTRDDATQLGFRPATISRRVREGVWRRIVPGVFGFAGVELTPYQVATAAQLAFGEEGAIARRSAAAAHRLARERWRLPVHVVVPYRETRDWNRKLVTVHRSRTLDGHHRELVNGIATTTIPRTIVECALDVDEARLRSLVADGMRRGVPRDVLLGHLDEAGRIRGATRLRRVLALMDPAAGRTDSDDEIELFDLVVGAGLPTPVLNHEIIGATGQVIARPDLAWPHCLAAVEIDGYPFHWDPNHKAHDLTRQNLLEDAAWRFRRFTPSQVRSHPTSVLRSIRRLLTQQGCAVPA